MNDNTGTITFKSDVQASLWSECIKGQLSDGYWENTRPHNHWRFWCNLEVCVGETTGVLAKNEYECRKNNYNLNAIKEFVLDELLKTGRMACAANSVLTYELGGAARYMPATLELWMQSKTSGGWQHDFIAKYMESVSEDLARAYYAAKYTTRDLNKDLTAIKEVMKTATKW